jgi:hypothetical protein
MIIKNNYEKKLNLVTHYPEILLLKKSGNSLLLKINKNL